MNRRFGRKIPHFVFWISIFGWILFHAHCKPIADSNPKANKGVLILSNDLPTENKIFPLEGEWEFQEGFERKQSVDFISVPGFWENSEVPAFKDKAFGAATYRLKVIGLKPGEYAIKFHEIHNAYRVFINGKMLLEFGRPSQNPETEVRRIGKPIVHFLVENDKVPLEIILEVSNWFEAVGGIRRTPELGNFQTVLAIDKTKRKLDFLTFGALLFFGFSSFFFYLLTKEESSSIYLSLVCATLGLRIFFTEEHYIFEAFPNFPPLLEFRIDQGSLFFLAAVFLSYIRSLFPNELKTLLYRILVIPNFLMLGIFWMFRGKILESLFEAYLIFMFLLIVVVFVVMIRAALHKRTGSFVFLISCLLLLFGALNDTLSRLGLIPTPYIVPYTFLLFIAFQSVLISIRYRSLLKFTDSLNRELQVKFRAISASIQEAILVSDVSGKILFWNEGAVKIFGWEGEEILDSPLERILPERIRNKHKKAFTRFFTSGRKNNPSQTIEMVGLKKDNTEFSLELSLTHWILEKDRYIGLIIRDVTQRKNLESQRDKALNLLQSDLHTAEKLQKSMFPNPRTQDWPFVWSVLYLPMGPIGGDLYDIRKTKNGSWRFFIADATGHGTQAALLTMAIKADYDTVEEMDSQPGIILEQLNQKIHPMFHNLNSLFTAFILDWDPNSGKIQYASGGHPEQIILTENTKITLPKTGPILGLKASAKFQTRSYRFDSPIRLFLFSDGAFEVFDKNLMQLYGEERFHSYLHENSQTPISEILDSHLKSLYLFRESQELMDDLTLLAITLGE
ncbi:SpoIIE family protein phosphatase [Leptospira sp. 201903071]|uniref:SpoIIE family protein phosphatase n=1 Tax=Leptospira ainazelensis TaxID=2810034 RepID=UPI0019650361|nr:SpoIIE family protein phosphatase [Leptospira ainazelensis]MBM9499195.1 SpoIIE family protein phosphatase [Leptospira ainazelensis]